MNFWKASTDVPGIVFNSHSDGVAVLDDVTVGDDGDCDVWLAFVCPSYLYNRTRGAIISSAVKAVMNPATAILQLELEAQVLS